MRMLFIALAIALLSSACLGNRASESTANALDSPQPQAKPDQYSIPLSECFSACRQANRSLENGPCLLDPVPSNPAWACDVVHDPKTAADLKPENRCRSDIERKIDTFIELTPDCQLLRVV